MAHILRRSLLVVTLVAVLTALALPVMATDEPSGETTEIPAGDAPEPAVPIPEEAPVINAHLFIASPCRHWGRHWGRQRSDHSMR